MPPLDFQKPSRQSLELTNARRGATTPIGFGRRFLADEIDLDDLTVTIQRLLDSPAHAGARRRKTDLPSGPARVTHVLEAQ